MEVLSSDFCFISFLADLGECIRSPSQLEDTELTLLATSLPFILENVRARSTTRKYRTGWLGWVNWRNTKGEVQTRPADPFYVALYLNHLFFLHGNKGCISTAFYGIRWAHHMVGLDSPTDNPLVKLVYEGCTRLCGGRKIQRDALPVETLRSIVDACSQKTDNLFDSRFLVVCLTGFVGFFRIQELSDVQLQHIAWFPDHIQVFLTHSKVDQRRDGDTVFIARTGTKYSRILEFLEKAELDIEKDKNAFLIPRNATGRRKQKAFHIPE